MRTADFLPSRLLALFLGLIVATASLASPPADVHARHGVLQDELKALAKRARPGLFGIVVLDPRSGERWRVNADRAYPMMSVFKAPVAASVQAVHTQTRCP